MDKVLSVFEEKRMRKESDWGNIGWRRLLRKDSKVLSGLEEEKSENSASKGISEGGKENNG